MTNWLRKIFFKLKRPVYLFVVVDALANSFSVFSSRPAKLRLITRNSNCGHFVQPGDEFHATIQINGLAGAVIEIAKDCAASISGDPEDSAEVTGVEFALRVIKAAVALADKRMNEEINRAEKFREALRLAESALIHDCRFSAAKIINEALSE